MPSFKTLQDFIASGAAKVSTSFTPPKETGSDSSGEAALDPESTKSQESAESQKSAGTRDSKSPVYISTDPQFTYREISRDIAEDCSFKDQLSATVMVRIARALEQQVALLLYAQDMPLESVYRADPSGLVESAIRAKAAEMLSAPAAGAETGAGTTGPIGPIGPTADTATSFTNAELLRLLRAAGRSPSVLDGVGSGGGGIGEISAAGLSSLFSAGDTELAESQPPDPDWQTDPAFYDKVRQLALYLHVPFDDLTDLDELARQHQWSRGTIDETMAGLGLGD